MFGFGKATAKLASLFGELAEAQKKIDDSAKRVVEAIERMVDFESKESPPSSREAFRGRDLSWYEQVSDAFTSDGFMPPVAYAVAVSRPAESHLLSEYALGDDRSIVACWFVLPGTDTRPPSPVVSLFTLLEDGSTFDTVAGGIKSPLPSMETEHEERLPEGTPVAELLARHRAQVAAHGSTPQRFESVEAYQMSRRERKRVCKAYWRSLGLSLVEQFIEARYTGDKADIGAEYLAAIRRHPEWYKYANGAPTQNGTPEPAATPERESAAKMPLNFMMSATEDGRRTITTFGMLFSGLPELLLREVAANHCRAARVLAGSVIAGLARHRGAIANEEEFLAQLVSERGARITIARADAITAEVTGVDENRPSAPVEVHLALRGFSPGDEPSLLHVNPLPDEPRSFDERLREACARLGVDVPAARGADSAEDAMRQAHDRAVARLDEARARWKNRDVTGERVCVKFRATKGERGEYVWIEVRDWRDNALDGEVLTPAPRVGVELGQVVTIERSQIYDYLVTGQSGAAMPALTDVVATDYGMDL